MEEQRIREIQIKIRTLLQEQRLGSAIEALSEDIDNIQDWELNSRFNELNTEYGYLLNYFSQGTKDTQRITLYKKLFARCYVLNDEIAINRLSQFSTAVYFQMRRKHQGEANITKASIQLVEYQENKRVLNILPKEESEATKKGILTQHEEILNNLFCALWSQKSWNAKQQTETESLLLNDSISLNDRALFISAITLSLFKYFDPLKLSLLLTFVENDESLLRQRALIGAILIIYTSEKEILFFSEITSRINLLSDNPRFKKELITLQIQLFRCRETKKIDKKMREEIIPAMLKNPHIRNPKLGLDLDKDLQEDDKNPEWEKWIESKDIKNKLEEMTQWQMEGADIYISTFSQLKNFSFFQTISNWFRIFETDNPVIMRILPEESSLRKIIFNAIFSSKFFCNSDKFSFCLTLEQVPQEQRQMLMDQVMSQKEGLEDGPETIKAEQPTQRDAEQIGNQYIQDLYRFFKLSNFRNEFIDPFTLSLNLIENKILAEAFNETESLYEIAKYLITKSYYHEAYNILDGIQSMEGEDKLDAYFYQQMGYCLQKQNRYEEAIVTYKKSDIVKPNTLWTIKHIAQCYRITKQIEKALEYYIIAETINENNIPLLMQMGECLTYLKRYEEAFKVFYKINYLDNDSQRSWRALAWCSFVTGNMQQATKYYNMLLNEPNTIMQDWLNAGHTAWVVNEESKAIEYYKKAAGYCKNIEDFIIIFFEDKEELIEHNIKNEELYIMRDILLRD